ncbi:MAG: hypothetical protein AAGD25_24320 [Cyanobacteria bacterium P01_F01_bin.150]
MKYCGQWIFIPIALASTFVASILPAWAAPQLTTPLQGTETIRVTSTTQAAPCNAANTQPEAVSIQVTGGLTSINFDVSGSGGQPTLRVVNKSNGDETCVTADNLSGSQVELSAAWDDGNYSVYVGDRNGESHTFTLSIR